MTEQRDDSTSTELRLRGGPWAALIPALVLVGVLTWLSAAERASTSAFWIGGFLAIIVGLLLATDTRRYAESVVRGLSDRTGAVIIIAFIFAGVFGTLMKNGGLVEGLLWIGTSVGLTGAAFTVLTFLLAAVFATGTGTSVGTVLAMVPVLYPAGVYLGADPTMLAVALLAGGAFGDNLGPVSDTTITSSYTQGAAMGDVVRSRLPLALSAGAVAIVVFAVTGGGGTVSDSTVAAEADPLGLVMLVPLIVVVGLALTRRHILVSLVWGIISAVVIALLTRSLGLGEIVHLPEERGESSGLIEDGISGVTAVVVLVLLIMALAQVFADSGLMRAVLTRLERRAAQGVRGAELMIIAVSVLASVPLGANAPAILLVGPTIAKPLGQEHGLSPQRRANLLDCSVCTVFYMLPWHNAVIVWFATVSTVAADLDLPVVSLGAAFANPYAWALLVVIVTSAVTGWNRSYSSGEEHAAARA